MLALARNLAVRASSNVDLDRASGTVSCTAGKVDGGRCGETK